MRDYFKLIENPTTIQIITHKATITLNRSTGSGIVSRKSEHLKQTSQSKITLINGILGLIKLRNSSYIVCVTKSISAGSHLNYPVRMVKKVKLIKFRTFNTKVNDNEDINNIIMFFNQPGFYYSEYPIYKNYVDHNYNEIDFLYNHEMINELEACVRGNVGDILLRCMQGYFGSRKWSRFTVNLISRRCWKRSGMRFFSRGCDKEGYPSNFVETEQILFDGENIVSFLQVRGSIPFVWEQNIGYKINPDIYVKDTNVFDAAHQIFSEHYGKIFYLNLIQHINKEKVLNDAFKKELVKKEMEFINFDFKNRNMEKCVKTRESLINDLQEVIDKHGISVNAEEEQNGIIRTNCIDCLDRTNVVQYLIGIEACKRQFTKLLEISSSEDEEKVEDMETIEFPDELNIYLRDLWYENGNMISIQYSGTPSLKNTIIKGGNQTSFGKIKDGYNCLKRYYLNRFVHGRLQDGYSLVTGNFQNMKRRKKFRFRYKILLLIISILVAVMMPISFKYTQGKKFLKYLMGLILAFFIFFRIFFNFIVLRPTYI